VAVSEGIWLIVTPGSKGPVHEVGAIVEEGIPLYGCLPRKDPRRVVFTFGYRIAGNLNVGGTEDGDIEVLRSGNRTQSSSSSSSSSSSGSS